MSLVPGVMEAVSKEENRETDPVLSRLDKLQQQIERMQQQMRQALYDKGEQDPRLQTYQVDEWRDIGTYQVKPLVEAMLGSAIAEATDGKIPEGYHYAKWTDRTIVLARTPHYEYDPAHPERVEQVIKIRGYFNEPEQNKHLLVPDDELLLGKLGAGFRRGFGKDAKVFLTHEPRGDDRMLGLPDILKLRGEVLRDGFNPWDVHPYNVQRVRGEVKIIDQDALLPLENMFKTLGDKPVTDPDKRREHIMRELFFGPLEMSKAHMKHYSSDEVVATLVTCSMVMRAMRDALGLSPEEVLACEQKLELFLFDAGKKAGVSLTPDAIHKLAGEASYGTLQMAAENLNDLLLTQRAKESALDIGNLIEASSRDADDLAIWAKGQVQLPVAA